MVTINTPQGSQDMRGNEGHGSQSIIELGYKTWVKNLDNQYTYPIKQLDPKHKSYNNLPYKMKKSYHCLIALSELKSCALHVTLAFQLTRLHQYLTANARGMLILPYPPKIQRGHAILP
jgi:hypothetical protein